MRKKERKKESLSKIISKAGETFLACHFLTHNLIISAHSGKIRNQYFALCRASKALALGLLPLSVELPKKYLSK